MNARSVLLGAIGVAAAGFAMGAEGPVPNGIPNLDHVFLIVMENHGYSQIWNNPSTPFANSMINLANTAINYFAVAHPSLTNYLEIAGGSNFGVQSDNYPDWHDFYCQPNIATGMVNTDNPSSSNICPIFGSGTDAATPAIDNTNETSGPPGENNIDGTQSIPAATNVSGKTIADQLAEVGKTWKSYQESVPDTGVDNVNYSDGFYSNLTDFSKIKPALTPPLSSSNIVALYAAKHNPFVYFRSVQEGEQPGSDLTNTVGFDGWNGLYADLRSGSVPTLSFIAPNQCNDQHGRGNGTAFCNFDPTDNGSQAGLNPALMQQGDETLKKIVTAIKRSPVWNTGHNAIAIVWDENDYSTAPNTNQVLLIVDTNYGTHGVQSNRSYNHFSLLKSIEAGLNLPCLNHACDSTVNTMVDLFGTN